MGCLMLRVFFIARSVDIKGPLNEAVIEETDARLRR
jgi:hypothetical protein